MTAHAAPPNASAAGPASAAQVHLDEWNARGKAACEAKRPACAKLAESLYHAAVEFQRAGDRNRAVAARLELLESRYHLESTDLAKKAMFQLGEDYKALSEYAKSAEYYEKASVRASSMPEAPDALVDATIFRMSLGEFDLAVKNAELYDKLFGAAKPEMAVTVWLGIGRTLLDAQRFDEAKPILIKIVPRADRVGTVRDRFLAHAALGRALLKLNDKQGAEHEYDTVRALWRNTEIQKRLAVDTDADPRNMGRVLNAVGEALFFFAEQKRQEVDSIRYPEYKGPADLEQMLKHINTKVVDWIKKKKPAIEDAEMAYQQIVTLEPAPPPRWIIASSARVGTMWAKFVAEFRAAPIPDAWKIGDCTWDRHYHVTLMSDLHAREVLLAGHGVLDVAERQRQQDHQRDGARMTDASHVGDQPVPRTTRLDARLGHTRGCVREGPAHQPEGDHQRERLAAAHRGTGGHGRGGGHERQPMAARQIGHGDGPQVMETV